MPFFSRDKWIRTPSRKSTDATTTSPMPPTIHEPHLQAKFSVSPVLHPSPFRRLTVRVTPQGLVIRPEASADIVDISCVRIAWGKSGTLEQVSAPTASDLPEVSIHGVVGILSLFHAAYLLVVSDRNDVGNILNESNTVYCVKGVAAIPLDETRATSAVNSLAVKLEAIAAKNARRATMVAAGDPEDELDVIATPEPERDAATSLHVKFATPGKDEEVTPLYARLRTERPHSPSPLSSASSTPPSSLYEVPLKRSLASKLSFWAKPSKRAQAHPESKHVTAEESFEEFMDTMAGAGGEATPAQVLDSIVSSSAPPPTTEEKYSALEDKIVRECIREYTKGGMYFAYDFDITTPLQRKQEQLAHIRHQSALLSDLKAQTPQDEASNVLGEPYANLPLWRRVEPKFWWNESLTTSFVEAGLHNYVLPIMQGYCQLSSFDAPTDQALAPVRGETANEEARNNIEYIIVSRRSKERAGLRYQRRGIDEDANVANFVETEVIMRVVREGVINVFSYIQIRGSIPLFWSQPGYSLKPAPKLDRSLPECMGTLRKHFERVVTLYGPNMVVNLAELSGKEAVVTTPFREGMRELNWNEASYHEFDFHHECKGMRYENISKLLTDVERCFESQGYFWVSGAELLAKQNGVFRVNCIDCLDRTNVVQSAFARNVLQHQLQAVALVNTTDDGRSDADYIFNDVWANNGDAISRAYAGTSALKGDFTRTGKRDFTGMLNDGLWSLTRMYTATFSDFFSQAVIDYMLGNRSLSVFSEFMLNLSATDPREMLRVSKIRAAAIETCISLVLYEGESAVGGWTLFSPTNLNVKIGDKFEEKVLLLSKKAIYIVSYDYSLEKVKMFVRVPLGDIVSLKKGAYILSPLQETSRDPLENYGFMINYRPSSKITTRITTYSIRNQPPSPSLPSSLMPSRKGSLFDSLKPSPSRTKSTSRTSLRLSKVLSNAAFSNLGSETAFVAFKALPVDGNIGENGISEGSQSPIVTARSAKTCKESVDIVVETIRRVCIEVGTLQEPTAITEGDIVSVSEAQRITPFFAKIEYGVKKLLWLGS